MAKLELKRKRRRRSFPTWLFFTNPGNALLVVVIVLICVGAFVTFVDIKELKPETPITEPAIPKEKKPKLIEPILMVLFGGNQKPTKLIKLHISEAKNE